MNQPQECPQCGATVLLSERRCGYCRAEFFLTDLAYLSNLAPGSVGKYIQYYSKIITSEPENAEALLGLGLCYLQSGIYPLASKAFDKVVTIASDISQGYYYGALCAVKGRRLGSLTLSEIKSVESFVNVAIQLDGSRVEFKLLAAMVKRDYYERNGLRVSGSSCADILSEIGESAIPAPELARLFESVRVGDNEVYLRRIRVA